MKRKDGAPKRRHTTIEAMSDLLQKEVRPPPGRVYQVTRVSPGGRWQINLLALVPDGHGGKPRLGSVVREVSPRAMTARECHNFILGMAEKRPRVRPPTGVVVETVPLNCQCGEYHTGDQYERFYARGGAVGGCPDPRGRS